MQYEIINNKHVKDFGIKKGDVGELLNQDGYGIYLFNKNWKGAGKWWVSLDCVREFSNNRQFLQDFIKLNQIKTTLVSKYLGYSPSWLTTMANEKRRGDLSDESLKAILKKLHIDWSSNEFINVKATKEHTAYRTRPNTYTIEVHKERLQKAMWLGLFVKA